MAFSYDLLVREHHVDVIGHMNNSTYLQIFEETRWEFLTERGYGFKKIQQSHQAPIILEVNLKFLKEIRLRDQIRITLELVEYQGKIGKLKQQMIKDDGSVAADALFTFGLFDMKTRKLIEPTPEFNRALQE